MVKSIMFAIPVISILICIACKTQDEYSFSVQIDDINNEKLVTIPLDKQYARQKIEVLENSINDTCTIGIMELPPGAVGKIYDIEFFNDFDTLEYRVKPYKATKGSLRFKHVFYNY